MSATSVGAAWNGRSAAARTAALAALCCAELLVISLVREIPQGGPTWLNPYFYFRTLGLWGLSSAVALALLSWPRRHELVQAWRRAQADHDWRAPLLLNLALFGTFLAAVLMVRSGATGGGLPAPYRLALHSLLIGATVVSMAGLDVPFRTALQIATRHRTNLAVAALAGMLVPILSYLSQEGWRPLAGATLELTRAILQLYEPDVVVDVLERKITIGNFSVTIWQNCSGYEGIGLVTAFLSIYLWAFRANLRFPHAFLLFPIGVSTIWVLNAVRIAALTSIGAHLSPLIAVHGFHSLAGWIAFLIVTLAIMALAHRSTLISRDAVARRPAADGGRLAAAYLAPLFILMVASTVTAAFAPHDIALYPLKAAAVAAVLYAYRDVYLRFTWRLSGVAVLAGLAVGAAWIATDPDPASGATLGAWLAQQGTPVTIAWLVSRSLGSVVLVPIAEELAFRGFLYRWLIARKFEEVSFAHVSLIALVVSSLLFGMLHERWLAASLSGAVFALVMWRERHVCAAIVAHAAANAVICAWAIGLGQWSLL